MRRSGSSSCLLRPKESIDEDEKSIGSSEGGQRQLSVTVINTEQLPTYSTERFFMLSEIEEHGHSTRFLSDIPAKFEAECSNHTSQQSTSSRSESGSKSRAIDESSDDDNYHLDTSAAAAATTTTTDFPPFIIVYFLWRPDMTNSVNTFIETEIVLAVRKIQNLIPIKLSASVGEKNINNKLKSSHSYASLLCNEEEEAAIGNRSCTSLSSLNLVEGEEGNDNEDEEEINPYKTKYTSKQPENMHHLYLVVDRVIPAPSPLEPTPSTESNTESNTVAADDDDNSDTGTDREQQKLRHFQVHTGLAETLAKRVSSHPYLRTICEGITVGVSNHERAAPGIEACLTAIAQGARIRRQISTGTTIYNKNHKNISKKSSIGILGISPQDLLGIQQDSETDAAEGVNQIRINSEWNGNGNIYSFASRAHTWWRIQHNLPVEDDFYNCGGSPPSSPTRNSSSSSRNRKKKRKNKQIQQYDNALNDLQHYEKRSKQDTIINIFGFFVFMFYLWYLFGNDRQETNNANTASSLSSEL